MFSFSSESSTMISAGVAVACRDLAPTDQPLHGRQKRDQPLQHLVEQLESHSVISCVDRNGPFGSPRAKSPAVSSRSMPVDYEPLAEGAPPDQRGRGTSRGAKGR